MDKDDQEIVSYALSWRPYGGPPRSEVLVNFGMTLNRFHSRVHEILSPNPDDDSKTERQKSRVRGALHIDVMRDAPIRLNPPRM